MSVRRVQGSMHLKACIQSYVFIKNLAQYPIEFLKLFRFFDKNCHNHFWFFTWFLEMKYSIFFLSQNLLNFRV
jgi:hypothetical protein